MLNVDQGVFYEATYASDSARKENNIINNCIYISGEYFDGERAVYFISKRKRSCGDYRERYYHI